VEFNIEKSVKFIFEDPNWLNKLVPFFIIQVIISVISFLAQIDPFFIMLGILILLLPLIIPYSIYLIGYRFETMENVMQGSREPLPTHTNIGYKLKLWWYVFIISIGPVLLLILLGLILFIPMLLATIYSFEELSLIIGLMSLIVTIFIGILFTILFLAYSITVYPAMLYIFFQTRSINEAYTLSNILSVLSTSWKDFLLMYLIVYAITMIGRFIGLLSWFALMGWLVTPIINTIVSFIQFYILGDVFRQLSAKEVLFK
jgi:hypothetical protein